MKTIVVCVAVVGIACGAIFLLACITDIRSVEKVYGGRS